jgi:hypothetical protein
MFSLFRKSGYSRKNPSPRYRELGEIYRRAHAEGLPDQALSPAELFAGWSLLPHVGTVKGLVERTGATSILDYGSGKGMPYRAPAIILPSGEQIPALRDHWKLERILCYDPGVPEHARLPRRPVDGVISTDALEHIPKEDIPWIVAEMFGASRLFVFANIASFKAKKTLPNGENAHCTIEPPAWWREVFEAEARRRRARYHIEVVEWVPGRPHPDKVTTFSTLA